MLDQRQMSEASSETLSLSVDPATPTVLREKAAAAAAAVESVGSPTPTTLVAARSIGSSDAGEEVEYNLPGTEQVILVRTWRWRRRRWALAEGTRLHNNLFWSIGLLELANAGDFAANVWNDIPVPLHAIILMAIGATFALTMATVAMCDARAAWKNMRFLRRQQKILEDDKQRLMDESQPTHAVDVLIEMTCREFWIETVVRFAMDVFQGGGAIPLAIGTYMAIGGANHKVWIASNILSGYIGNTPIALYGLINATLGVYIWRKMHSHKRAAKAKLPGAPTTPLLLRRFLDIQCFYVVNGTGSVVGGAASLVAATRWWGYVMLIPVIVSALLCNAWWRRRIGYTRPYVDVPSAPMDADSLLRALEFTVEARQTIQENPQAALDRLVPRSESLQHVLSFFLRYDLLESYCLRIVNDTRLSHHWFAPGATQLRLGVAELLALPESHHQHLLDMASEFLRDEGADRFLDRQRFLAEVLGIYITTIDEDRVLEANGDASTSEESDAGQEKGGIRGRDLRGRDGRSGQPDVPSEMTTIS